MSKKRVIGLFLILPVLLVLYFLFFTGTSIVPEPVITPSSEPTPELIGGQKDEHGCLGPAGYSWCENKQKCLRVWEEPCLVDTPFEEWLSYPSKNYGFVLKLPPSWTGYKAGEQDYPNYSTTGFSFGSPHQPFSILQIIRYTPDQWQKMENKSQVKILSQDATATYICDGCCGLTEDYLGGGQFDDFQIERCKEGAEIVKTFRLTSGD